MAGVGRQLRDNLVAITSLAVALTALGYNTWRNERTEHNRNVRVAGIEMLKEIGAFQQVIYYAHFGERAEGSDAPGDPRGDPRMGWVGVMTMQDLAAVMPAPVAQEAAELRAAWETDSEHLIEDTQAFRRIDAALDELRQATLAALAALD